MNLFLKYREHFQAEISRLKYAFGEWEKHIYIYIFSVDLWKEKKNEEIRWILFLNPQSIPDSQNDSKKLCHCFRN